MKKPLTVRNLGSNGGLQRIASDYNKMAKTARKKRRDAMKKKMY